MLRHLLTMASIGSKRVLPITQQRTAFAANAGVGLRQFSKMAGDEKMLVIFDKDGTLITFEDSWIDWTITMSQKYAEKVQKPIQQEMYSLMGFNPKTKKFSDGLICDTDENIIRTLSDYLHKQHNLTAIEAKEFVQTHYFCYKNSNHVSVPVDNPRALFQELKQLGGDRLKIAVCTSDNSLGKDSMVRDLNLDGLIDFSLSGDDNAMKPKPDPQNIRYICESLGVSPKNTVMIGDARRDVEMGKLAEVWLSVGVLTGVCDREHLEDIADVIIPSIKHITPVIMPGMKKLIDQAN